MSRPVHPIRTIRACALLAVAGMLAPVFAQAQPVILDFKYSQMKVAPHTAAVTLNNYGEQIITVTGAVANGTPDTPACVLAPYKDDSGQPQLVSAADAEFLGLTPIDTIPLAQFDFVIMRFAAKCGTISGVELETDLGPIRDTRHH
jgi:hypothetical protein